MVANLDWHASVNVPFELGSLDDPLEASTGSLFAQRVEAQFHAVTSRIVRTREKFQRALMNMILSGFRWETVTPRGLLQMSHRMIEQSAADIQSLIPGRQNQLAWQELHNKLQAFYLFEYVDAVLNVPRDQNTGLDELVAAASYLDPYLAVWAAEGLGHYYADWSWEHRGMPQNLLSSKESAWLPSTSLVPLHTGMGLCFADRLLRAVRSQACASEIAAALQNFSRLCRVNSRNGYFGATYEALGMAARSLYPQMISIIDRQLLHMDPELAGYFWHGVGRAIYFAPTHFLPHPSTFRRAVECSRHEPGHPLGMVNAIAGLAWALTLVNIRHPEILEQILRSYGEQFAEDDAFSNGVCSSVMIWRDMTSDHRLLKAFCCYRPISCDLKMTRLWNTLVGHPCEAALRCHYPILKRQNRVGDLFRYRPLSDWSDPLDSTEESRAAGFATTAGN